MKKREAAKKELAKAMVDAGCTYREASEATGISIGTVHNLIAGRTADTGPLANAIMHRFSSRCLMMADYMLEDITKYDIGKATLQQRMISIAILLDKALALEKSQKSAEPASEHLNRTEG